MNKLVETRLRKLIQKEIKTVLKEENSGDPASVDFHDDVNQIMYKLSQFNSRIKSKVTKKEFEYYYDLYNKFTDGIVFILDAIDKFDQRNHKK